jgi:hypothetical protein
MLQFNNEFHLENIFWMMFLSPKHASSLSMFQSNCEGALIVMLMTHQILQLTCGSSDSPHDRSGSLTWQRERTNSSQNNGSKRQVISWGRPFRNKSDSGMAFQLSDAHRFPPGSQVHCMDSSNSENDHTKTHHIERLTTSSVDFVPCITTAKIDNLSHSTTGAWKIRS